MKHRSVWVGFAAIVAAVTISFAGTVRAEVSEVKLARQFSMGYLQFNVMEHQKLIEKHARMLGMPDVKVTWVTFNGPAAVNEALISGSIDIGSGAPPGLILLWSKTRGTPNEVRGISALSSQPFLLNTRNPAVKTIADLATAGHIAVPTVRVSIQAIVLEMAAAKMFGPANYAKFDTLTVSLPPPDATIALLSGAGEIDSVFSVPPFQYQQLENPKVRTILNSFDVLDGPHSFTLAYASTRFRDRNPVLYKAIFAAIKEATDLVNADKQAAAALWIEDSRSNLPLELVTKIASGPQVQWTIVPESTMKFAQFMTQNGMLQSVPKSWRDYFFPEIYDTNGG